MSSQKLAKYDSRRVEDRNIIGNIIVERQDEDEIKVIEQGVDKLN